MLPNERKRIAAGNETYAIRERCIITICQKSSAGKRRCWDKKRKKKVKVSEYMGRITEHGLVERNRRSIYEFENFDLLLSITSDLITELKRGFPDHWWEILAMSIIRVENPSPIKFMKST